MFNNRMLAVAAVLALAVPALGAAAPVVVSTATGEQLVEGHTVFTVIETSSEYDVNGTTRFAAAVAVLVREYTAESRNVRFPGVLWFNDQYLVNPESGAASEADYRYPCGGAVMAVNRGDPDPRVNLASLTVTGVGSTPGTGETPYSNVNATVDTTDPAQSNADSDAFLSGMNLPQTSSTSPGASHVESYVITDPNDHLWVIDKYRAYYRASASEPNALLFSNFVWVVNVLGSPVFIPDDGTLDCSPFYDGTLESIHDQAGVPTMQEFACTQSGNQPYVISGRDNPCKGYAEPSANGYCYGGQAAADYGGDCTQAPARLYNAVLYFKLEDLSQEGAVRTHTTGSTDTNGCSQGTVEWACPGGDDNAEGNSHPFHPQTAGHNHQQTCDAGSATAASTNPTNHGGSAGATYGTDVNGNYGPLPCDYTHATRDIDIYFSARGRPARPLTAQMGTGGDQEGSSAPFQDYSSAYGTTPH